MKPKFKVGDLVEVAVRDYPELALITRLEPYDTVQGLSKICWHLLFCRDGGMGHSHTLHDGSVDPFMPISSSRMQKVEQ